MKGENMKKMTGLVCAFCILTGALVFLTAAERAEAVRRRPAPLKTKACISNKLTGIKDADCNPYQRACRKGSADMAVRISVFFEGSNTSVKGPEVRPGETKCMDTTGKTLLSLTGDYKTDRGDWRSAGGASGAFPIKDYHLNCSEIRCSVSY
jgi:hypothetical protein